MANIDQSKWSSTCIVLLIYVAFQCDRCVHPSIVLGSDMMSQGGVVVAQFDLFIFSLLQSSKPIIANKASSIVIVGHIDFIH